MKRFNLVELYSICEETINRDGFVQLDSVNEVFEDDKGNEVMEDMGA